MRPGDIALHTGTDFYAKLIQWGTRSRYSHCAIVSDVNAMGPVIIEATQAGLVTTQLRFDAPGWEYRDSEQTDAERAESLKYARRHAALKVRYNYADIVMIALHLTFKWWNIAIMNHKDFCSEYLSRCLMRGGWDFPEDPVFISPADIALSFPKPAS